MPFNTLADDLQRLVDATDAIGQAIIDAGGTVNEYDRLEEYPADIKSINRSTTSIDITENGSYYAGEENTITTSSFPITIRNSVGTPMKHVTVDGNMQQNGTPTPQNPIQPNETGDKTGNLFDENNVTGIFDNKYINQSGTIVNANDYYISCPIAIDANSNYTWKFNEGSSDGIIRPTHSQPTVGFYDNNDNLLSVATHSNYVRYFSFTTPSNCAYIRASVYKALKNEAVLNKGTTPIAYQPYGYKIPISSGNTIAPVYLGEVPTTRNIQKLVLDGTENWKYSTTSQAHWIENVPNDYDNTLISRITTVCTHYKCIQNNTGFTGMTNGNLRLYAKESAPIAHELYIKDETYTSADDFKAYLQQQYTAGTPVTVWYVLATPTTAVVNEPLRKIGDYVDTVSADINLPLSSTEPNTVDVETSLKASSASFTYNIKNEYIGYNEINVDVPNTYTVADEGKVVSNGSLVSQTAKPTEITTNNTYDTTTYNSVTVNVENSYTASDEGKVVSNGSLVAQTAKPDAVVKNGVYDTTMYNSVNVKVSSELQKPKDVNFYDYEGTVVKSYTAAEFANISELPSNPAHEGLTAQGWNWSLVDAKAHVAKYGKLNIGQMYITDDGKTRIYITLTEGRISPILQLYLNVNSELDIDWGDGSTHSTFTTSTSVGYVNERHNYATAGDYVIAITVIAGSFNLRSSSTYASSILWNGDNTVNSPNTAYNNSIKKIEIGTKMTKMQAAFRYCYSLTSITIPDGVTDMEGYDFYNCSSLTSITIPDKVTSIGSSAFSVCNSLTSVTIPNGVTSIGSQAFNACYVLTSIAIPDGVTDIDISAFAYCYSLTSITIPDGVTSIRDRAFSQCSSLTSITIPDKVTSIGNYVFSSCNSLTSVTIGNSVTSIGNNAFYACRSLASIAIPDKVTSIGDSDFYACRSLSSITLGNSVTSIGTSAFRDCSSLASITIPESVTTISGQAFQYCGYMESIKFKPTTPPTVSGSYTWDYVPTTCIIYVPTGTLNAYKTATNYPNPSTYTYIEY